MSDDLKTTPLHATHEAAGAKMVDFSGFHMPLQYEGILAEHRSVRESAGIFDVSHMGEADFTGAGALDAIQKLITNDASKLGDGQALYTAVCYPDGGIVDDCIVYRWGAEHYRIVINASNIDKDLAHFREHAGDLCTITDRSAEFGLLAVQGPEARGIIAGLAGDAVLEIPSFAFADATINGVPVTAARTGYTGEDGFELFVPADGAVSVWEAITGAGAKPIGLGARDTLRLEARLCLYGNDIDATTTPLEASLGWTVKLDKGDFVGREALAAQKEKGIERRLAGFKVTDRGIVRPGAEVIDEADQVIGKVTSGGPAPTVGGAIGLCYVPVALAKSGNTLRLRQRNKVLAAETVKGPFYRRPQRD